MLKYTRPIQNNHHGREMNTVIVCGYKILLRYDKDDAIWVASAPALPGCQTHGNSQADAVYHMKDAIRLQLDAAGEGPKTLTERLSPQDA